MQDHIIIQGAEGSRQVGTTGQHTEEDPPLRILKDTNSDDSKIHISIYNPFYF